MQMMRFHFILLFFLINTLCNAQSIEKRYNSHLSSDGVINFFHPKKLKKKSNVDMFIFDMTYISHSDSVTLNCSFRTQNKSTIKTLCLRSGNNDVYGNSMRILYREVRKHGYETRITSRFSIKDIKAIFNNRTPLIFGINLNDSSCCTAAYNKSAWEKESLNVTKILESINY